MTLVDISTEMLKVSRTLNPECEHIVGDMRNVRLNRVFDGVFIQDAVMYMKSEDDLYRAMETAHVHCGTGGIALFAPDFIKETFQPSTSHGGIDGADRGIRYLEWCYDPDKNDSTYICEFAILLREKEKETQVRYDFHELGLFEHDTWLRLLNKAGFEAEIVPDSYGRELFLGKKL
jgi:hypothetical protein